MSDLPYVRPVGARLPRVRGVNDLGAAHEIERLIRREAARADRTGRGFSLVLFGVKSSARPLLSTCRLARALLRRARVTDDVGWFSDQFLCALLTDTTAAGARVFAQRVCDAVGRKGTRPLSLVYSYPNVQAPPKLPRRQPEPESLRLLITSEPAKSNGNGNGNGNGKSNGNGNGHDHGSGNGNDHHDGNTAAAVFGVRESALAIAAPPATAAETQTLPVPQPAALPSVSCELAEALDQPGLDAHSLTNLLVHPMPRWKRALDITGSVIGLIVLAPLMVIAAIGIRLTSPGPIIFKQRRAGLGGKPFTIYKFRTMVVGADAHKQELRRFSEQDGPAFKMERDPRLTRFGRFLRKTSIDELPQLMNVLKGEMSLVGPRPLPLDESDACLPWQRRRLDITPGLTCIWQVKGRSSVTFDEWVRMDVEYMRRRTLAHDLWILLRTIPAVLFHRGAR